MATSLIDLAPQGPLPQREANRDRWDVFLSYRSSHRPWVLRLYDSLRGLQHEVFMDQFVLVGSENLARQLADHLDKSSTAVLIWSDDSASSAWCQEEFDTLCTLEKSKPDFRFVVIKAGLAELPLFARNKIWVDFSGQPDGPSGTNLLRVLYGLHGRPLSPEAVARAAEYDEAMRMALARIASARNAGDADALRALAERETEEWTTTSLLPCKVAEALIDLNQPKQALPLLDRVIWAFPRSMRPKQLKGLALARDGNWRDAQLLLGELEALGARDPETLGMLARTWRDRWEKESQDLIHLRRARRLYADAFAASPADAYTGINAASLSVLLGEEDEAERYAGQVEALVGTVARPGDYWGTATAAEAQLIRRRWAEAAALYARAVEADSEAGGRHDTTLAQARRLMDKLKPADADRDRIVAAFTRR